MKNNIWIYEVEKYSSIGIVISESWELAVQKVCEYYLQDGKKLDGENDVTVRRASDDDYYNAKCPDVLEIWA